jgi:outer membrane protein assembly factor BamB
MKTRVWKLVSMCLFIIVVSHTASMENTCNWSHTYGNGARTSYCDTDIVPPFEVLWKSTVQQGGIKGSPVVSGDYLVLVETLGTLTYDCDLICYRMTGAGLENMWSRSFSWMFNGISSVIAGNRVICHSLDRLHCFDLETGNTLWEVECESLPIFLGIIDAEMAAAITDDGYLSVIDISTGDIIFIHKYLNGVSCHFFEMVTVGDGNIFCCFTTSEEEGVAAFNVQGELLWKRTGEVRYRNVDRSLHVILYTEGILFVVFSDNTLKALDGESGDVLWSYQGKHLLDDLSSDGKHFYVYDKVDEGVVCLDVYSGEVLWKSPSLFPGDRDLRIYFYKSLVSSQNCVFICRHTLWDMDTPRIFALDRDTGEVIWTSEEIEDLQGPLILCNDLLIVETSKSLIAFGGSSTNSSTPETTPETQSPVVPLEPPTSPTFMILVIIGITGGILIMRHYFKKKSYE